MNLNFKSRLIIESNLVTILVFLVMFLLFYSLKLSFKPLNYVINSLKQVSISDIYFSKIKDQTIDTNIVIINVLELNRADIAVIIQEVNSYNPKVIGVDILFDKTIIDSVGDKILHEVINKGKDKLVLACYYDDARNNLSNDFINFEDITQGHINFSNNHQRNDVIRNFHPIYRSENKEYFSFSIEVANKIDKKYSDHFESKSDLEIINYVGDKSSYYILNGQDFLKKKENYKTKIQNKIVLLGFLGTGKYGQLDNLKDMFYTPMNETLFGRSHPDMYGVIVHANILSMILAENYLELMKGFWLWFFSFIVVIIHVIPFVYIFIKHHLWYHIFAKITQLVSLIFLLLIVFYALDKINLLIDFKYTFIALFISVDVLYLYETIAIIIYKKYKAKSIFISNH